MAYYFKKSVPKTPVWIEGGNSVVFETLDGKTGYKEVQMHYLADQLRIAQAKGRGGVVEITAEEYERDFAKKKPGSKPLSEPWREERGGAKSLDTISPTRPAVAVTEPAPAPAPPPVSVPDVPAPVIRPRVGKRSQARLP